MKVKNINLKNYLNFKPNLKLDLTYPKGHSKEGLPLDKVCFIGQSGTGKTSLLNLIKYFSFEKENSNTNYVSEELVKEGVEITFSLNGRVFSKTVNEDGNFKYFENGNEQSVEYEKLIYSELNNCKPWLITFPYNIIESSDFKQSHPGERQQISASEKFVIEEGKLISRKAIAKNQNIWDFSVSNISELWDIVFDEISIYRVKYLKEKNKFVENVEKDVEKAKVYLDEFKQWQAGSHNPIEELASKCLNRILNNFNIEVITNINFEEDDDLRFIKLKQLNNESHIPYPFLSTGTKQIILTALPLYFLEPKNAIITFDQPESSLYPDVQRLVIDAYKMLTNDSQLFYATHSPILASCFEPWEIIELQFDTQTGNVSQKKYYQGENKVANYNVDPRFLTWSMIYTELFGLDEDGNSQTRNPEIERLAKLKQEFDKLATKQNTSFKVKAKKVDEIKVLANKLGVDLQTYFNRVKQ